MFALHLLAHHWLNHRDSDTEFWAFWGCAFLQLCEFANAPRKQYTLSMLGATSQRLFQAQYVTNSQTLLYTTNVMSRWDLTPQTWCWGDWQLLPNPDSMQLWEVSPSGTSSNTRTGSVAHNVQVQMLVQYPCFQGVGPEQIEKLQEAAGTILNKLWNYDSAQHGIHHNLTIWSQKDLCLHCICWPIGWII